MKPSIAVDITARDKTEAGRKAAERGFGKLAQKTSAQAKDGGFAKLGKVFDGFSKFRTLDVGLDKIGGSLTSIGRASGEVNSNITAATRSALSFGGIAEGAFGGVAEGAAVAAGAVAALVTLIGAAAAAAYILGEKTAKTGAEIGRTAKTLGVSTQELQAARAAAERFGVTADATTASIDGLGSALYSAQYGGNNKALAILDKYNVKLKRTKDGAIDVNQALMDVADILAMQKDPQVQKEIASDFGVSGMLPALRRGSGPLKAEGADYTSSVAAFTDDEVARADITNRTAVALKQHLSGIEKAAGAEAMQATGAMGAFGIPKAEAAARASQDLARGLAHPDVTITDIKEGARDLVHSGMEAGRHLIEGGQKAGEKIVDAITTFTQRLEHRESGGHQTDRHGHVLTSSAGALGVRQMMPGTAEMAARRAGIPWDAHRFATDAGYDRQISDAHIAHLAKKYGGDQVLMAAAYNAGEGVLDGPYKGRDGKMHTGWLSRLGDPRKGEISDADFAKAIPFDETRKYAQNVAKAHVEITLKGAPPGTVARVSGAPGVDVGMRVARSLDTP